MAPKKPINNEVDTKVSPGQLSILLEQFFLARQTVMITGAPGIGKTDIVSAVANKLKMDMIVAHPVVDSPIDYKGLGFMDAKTGKADFFPFGNLRRVLEAEKPMVYFFDDLGQAPVAVQAAAMQMLLSRSINGKKIPDCVTFCAATNRKEDRAGVSGIIEPVKSRFCTIIELVPEVNAWMSWALRNDIPPKLVGFIKFAPKYLTEFKPTQDMSNSPSPRTIAHTGRILHMKLPSSIQLAALAGAAGSAFAHELNAFLTVFDKLPDPQHILQHPNELNIPAESLDLRYAMTVSLATICTAPQMPNFFKALSKWDKEFSVLGVEIAVRRDTKLVQTPAVMEFLQANKQVMFGIEF